MCKHPKSDLTAIKVDFDKLFVKRHCVPTNRNGFIVKLKLYNPLKDFIAILLSPDLILPTQKKFMPLSIVYQRFPNHSKI